MPDPVVVDPTDAVVRVEAAAVCGSDLWSYRGQSTAKPGSRIGHEAVGTVIATGDEVTDIAVGDWVIVPFRWSDGVCAACARGLTTSCEHGGFWGREITEACQAELLRVPQADGTLVRALPDGSRPDDALVPSMLALADVMGTGYHAALSAGVGPGSTTVVIGDGAVGQCAIIAARLLGAARVVALASTHADRQALARSLGADEVITARGDDAVVAVAALTDGAGADQVLECVGTAQSFSTALAAVRSGGTVSYVGIPHGVQIDLATLFARNVTITGGVAPVRHYLPALLPAVLERRIDPGRVFTDRLGLSEVAEAYRRMDAREALKVLIDTSA
ncbi:zinc-binding dehydrogenase [Demequina salsinemoris]|uniref:zinc-binding dehydrogenase n=1 Tax=Demequina salsinemoris TaxID=577470 RepID=UPI000B2126AB